MAADNSGQSWAVLAASEFGKGVWFKGWLRKAKPARLVIWDRMDEYGEHAEQAATLADLARLVVAARFAVRYVPRAPDDKGLAAEFDAFCRIAFHCRRACVVVEELADVTKASHAPAAWRRLNTAGRHHQGLHIVGFSQSPAWVDKSFLANATFFHVGFLGHESHRKAVAAEIGSTSDEINALVQFEYIEYRRATKEKTRGRVSLTPQKPAGKARKAAR